VENILKEQIVFYSYRKMLELNYSKVGNILRVAISNEFRCM